MSYVGTEAGMMTGKIVHLPNRKLLPNILYQASCESLGLKYTGSLSHSVVSGGIGFSERDAEMSTIGEFMERFSSGYIDKNRLTYATYKELKDRGLNALRPDLLKLYAPKQYEKFAKDGDNIVPFTEEDSVFWIRGVDLKNNDEIIYVPAFIVFLPYDNQGKENVYLYQTSTGLSAGDSIEGAQIGGFLEAAERNAFANWWYHQLEVPVYTVDTVLDFFKDDKDIERITTLIKSNKIKMKFYDLSHLGPVNTVICFMFYWHKGKFLQSMGCSSRFNLKDALIKAVLESYQGVELGIMLDDEKHLKEVEPEKSLEGVNSFNKHFAFYNSFPNYRTKVPIIKRALAEEKKPEPIVTEYPQPHMSSLSKKELEKADVPHVIRVDLTSPDVDSVGFKVVRVLVPGWAYLTGIHDYPFLGPEIFSDEDKLFTHLPHPFP
ncbi:MAG: YcaO-like family protein [Bacteroidales bacterium]